MRKFLRKICEKIHAPKDCMSRMAICVCTCYQVMAYLALFRVVARAFLGYTTLTLLHGQCPFAFYTVIHSCT